MLTVYQHPYSQHSRRVLALLEIAQAEYRTETVNLAGGEHRSPGFLVINPNHQVPVLIDDGMTLTESNAILRYLCNKFSLTDWYPADIVIRAQTDSWLDWNQCRLAPAVIDVVLNKVFFGDGGDADGIARGEANPVELGAILAAHLSDNDFLVGAAA